MSDFLKTNLDLDFSTAETFILSVLPWIEKETGLKAETGKLPLPFPVIVTDKPIDTEGGQAAGLYDHKRNHLYIVDDGSLDYVASIAVHEMVHWLQNVNGWMDYNHPENGKPREVVEELAYNTQYKFLSEVMHIPPEIYGMTKERIAQVLENEKQIGFRFNQGNVRSETETGKTGK